MPSAQEGLSGLAGSRDRAELCLPLCSVALSISVALVSLMAPVVYRWVLELGCPGGMSAPPAAARRGKPAGPPDVDTASLRAGSCGTLSSLALGSHRDVGELFPSEPKSNQPQTKHPAKLSGEGPWQW